jgi:hypothetical protein
MEWIEHIIKISSWLDKIIIITHIHWDTYATAISTAAAPLWLNTLPSI